jgi:hypothetical protein
LKRAPQGLKPGLYGPFAARLEAVLFQNRIDATSSVRRSLLRLNLLLVCSCILLAFSTSAGAQLRNHDAFFGYSRLGSDAFYPNVGGLNGWEGALHIHLHPFFGVEGDVAHYGLGANSVVPRTTTVLVGPRISVKAIGINLFAHGLIGGEHSANDSSSNPHISGGAFAYDLGGGIDLPIFPFFAWRFSADHINAPSQSPSGGTKGRFNTGLVFRF